MSASTFFGDPNLFNQLKARMKFETFCAGKNIEEAGSVPRRLFIIEKGVIRVFYRSEGREICCHFAKEGEIMTGIDSFFTGKPSIYTSQALEETHCYSLTSEQLEWAFDNIPSMDRFGRKFITAAYIELVERYNSVVSMSAQERYEQFMSEKPDLLNRVPLGYVASYLGMTQETLSRIRGKKTA
ncbi:MAG: Crp/Fnr family transcriptional regulator [Marinoscillum sp.]